jgi:deazaflavin-dependent oxidoreductase (nitroreductase family)
MSRLSRLSNAVPMLVLRSPAHWLLSGRYAVLEFTGRKSGRTYRTPVAYVRDDARVLMSTDSPWWRNLVDRPAVRLRLQGREMAGQARVMEDAVEAAEALGELVGRVPGYAWPAGVRTLSAGRASAEELRRSVTSGGRRSIEVGLVVTR